MEVSRDPNLLLEWRGLKFTLPLARLFAGFWLTIFVGAGCFWVILTPVSAASEQAAIAILSAITTAWIAALTRADR